MKKRLMYSIGCLVAIGAAFWISFFFQPKEKEASLGAPTPNDAFPGAEYFFTQEECEATGGTIVFYDGPYYPRPTDTNFFAYRERICGMSGILLGVWNSDVIGVYCCRYQHSCMSAENFVVNPYTASGYSAFREQFLRDWKMKTFDRDKALQPVDISEQAKATVPVEHGIWYNFLAVYTGEKITERVPPLSKNGCVIATGKVFSGEREISISKEISLVKYPDFRAEELLYWQQKRYAGSSPGKWDIPTEAQLRQRYLDIHFMFFFPQQRGGGFPTMIKWL